ncbi:MAG: hypothetical protein R3C03_20130 [Pirellulaceae bacterium]
MPFAKLVVRTLSYDNDRLTVYLQAEGSGLFASISTMFGFRMLDEGDFVISGTIITLVADGFIESCRVDGSIWNQLVMILLRLTFSQMEYTNS